MYIPERPAAPSPRYIRQGPDVFELLPSGLRANRSAEPIRRIETLERTLAFERAQLDALYAAASGQHPTGGA